MEISVKDARSRFSSLLDMVQSGDEVVILRRGKEVARLVPPRKREKFLPDLNSFRNSLKLSGDPLSTTVISDRERERF
ncbi:MAG: type II toxin-antitoxin system Phd/YefM family antitoxin [Thermodesulfobacteriota bacterium]